MVVLHLVVWESSFVGRQSRWSSRDQLEVNNRGLPIYKIARNETGNGASVGGQGSASASHVVSCVM